MDKMRAMELILEAKARKGLTFSEIAEAVDQHTVWTTSALLGQQQMSMAEADAVVDLLGLDIDVARALQSPADKGSLPAGVPTDPLIHRFHEIVQVYGTTLKSIICEEFGDGLMSSTDFRLDIERVADPAGDRVRVTLDGRFEPYRKW
ncbi:cyanase [Actinocorallia sp. A-T 12471]|uniref:cyanase n=1 Tax=Actinocorallia sp. A-T 12471 TaxID=3089813 RepID=UPI0029D0DAC9|nr:cyanase [Actinocorallia sp. A-T 12471]MDX6739517.1 cyanase [Actinocorallia sp. A-T 12471]